VVEGEEGGEREEGEERRVATVGSGRGGRQSLERGK
jgi:hypothetical protein